jgi:DNA polymerase-3 subunit delta
MPNLIAGRLLPPATRAPTISLMRVSTDQLARTLEKKLAPAWLVIGDEPLLVGEAADAIRERARAEGYAGRDLFFMERNFDWAELLGSSQSLSLFAERRIIELKMPSPRPGKDGGAVLAQLVSDPAPDTLFLVVTGRPERDTWSAAWFKAFEKHGVVVQCWPVEIGRLPQWIIARASRHGLAIKPDGAQLLAERVEGNLLAAHQEIEKLALLHSGGAIGVDEVLAAVANSARYDVNQLGEAALDGDAERSLRILDGLRAEGAEPALVLWTLCRDLRALADARGNPGAGSGYGRQAERRAALLERALRRTAGQPLAPHFIAAGRVDRQIKGLGQGNPWTGLTGLVAGLAGITLPEAPAA